MNSRVKIPRVPCVDEDENRVERNIDTQTDVREGYESRNPVPMSIQSPITVRLVEFKSAPFDY